MLADHCHFDKKPEKKLVKNTLTWRYFCDITFFSSMTDKNTIELTPKIKISKILS